MLRVIQNIYDENALKMLCIMQVVQEMHILSTGMLLQIAFCSWEIRREVEELYK